MVLAFLLGSILAIGHDRFYTYFSGRPVISTLEQQAVLMTGTAFSFLVKMFFTIASGIAFAQQIFHSLTQKSESIDRLDNLFSLLENSLAFRDPKLWLRHPGLLAIAVVRW